MSSGEFMRTTDERAAQAEAWIDNLFYGERYEPIPEGRRFHLPESLRLCPRSHRPHRWHLQENVCLDCGKRFKRGILRITTEELTR